MARSAGRGRPPSLKPCACDGAKRWPWRAAETEAVRPDKPTKPSQRATEPPGRGGREPAGRPRGRRQAAPEPAERSRTRATAGAQQADRRSPPSHDRAGQGRGPADSRSAASRAAQRAARARRREKPTEPEPREPRPTAFLFRVSSQAAGARSGTKKPETESEKKKKRWHGKGEKAGRAWGLLGKGNWKTGGREGEEIATTRRPTQFLPPPFPPFCIPISITKQAP